jgi:HSP20 family protein
MFELMPWTRREGEILPWPWPSVFGQEFYHLIKRLFGKVPIPSNGGRRFPPTINLSEADNEILIKAEMPGIDLKDLVVSLDGDILTIKGEKKDEKEVKGARLHRIERSFENFSRSLSVPCKVKEDEIEANYRDGILTVKLPKAEEAKRENVQIDVR